MENLEEQKSNWKFIDPACHRPKLAQSSYNNFAAKSEKSFDVLTSKLVYVENRLLGLLLKIDNPLLQKTLGSKKLFFPVCVNKNVYGELGEICESKFVLTNTIQNYLVDCHRVSTANADVGLFLDSSQTIFLDIEEGDLILDIE